MRALLVTLGILALSALSSQLFRHIYVRSVAPTTTVLEKYKDKTEKDIDTSQSLDELVRQYEAAYNKQKEWEKQNKWDQVTDEGPSDLHRAKAREWAELNRPVAKLERAIREWEERSQEVLQLHFFWLCGAGCAIVGLLCLLCSRWFAVALLALGFAEMIYWTSPSFFRSGGVEFERLLFWKVTYTAIALAFLILMWGILIFWTRQRESPSAIS